jgi:hypothetical protein
MSYWTKAEELRKEGEAVDVMCLECGKTGLTIKDTETHHFRCIRVWFNDCLTDVLEAKLF